jgi:hypothetical protein
MIARATRVAPVASNFPEAERGEGGGIIVGDGVRGGVLLLERTELAGVDEDGKALAHARAFLLRRSGDRSEEQQKCEKTRHGTPVLRS